MLHSLEPKLEHMPIVHLDFDLFQVGHKYLPDDEAFLGLPFVADSWGASGIYFMPRRANSQLVFGSVAHR